MDDRVFCIMLDNETDVFDRLYPDLPTAIRAAGCFVAYQDYRAEMRIMPCRRNPVTNQWMTIGRAWVQRLTTR